MSIERLKTKECSIKVDFNRASLKEFASLLDELFQRGVPESATLTTSTYSDDSGYIKARWEEKLR